MPKTDFEHKKKSLIQSKRAKKSRLASEVDQNWIEIFTEEYVFSRAKIEAACIASITREDLIGFLDDQNKCLRKISFQTVGMKSDKSSIEMEECELPRHITTEYLDSDDKPTVQDVEAFKNNLDVYPGTKVIIDF